MNAPDECLVRCYQQTEDPAVVSELWRRHGSWMTRYVASHARAVGVPASDTEDAQQNAFWALRYALDHYDTGQVRGVGFCRFRSFLQRALMSNLVDSGRRLSRSHLHHDQSVDPAALLETRSHRIVWVVGCAGFEDPTRGDPARLVERAESWTNLERRVDRLGVHPRLVWEAVAQGESLHSLAERLGVTYRTVLNWSHELKHRLGRAGLEFRC
jgi:hypothetical protein